MENTATVAQDLQTPARRAQVNKTALVLLAFFLGAFGAHKFYVGKPVQGVFYFLFCWTGIPGFIAFIEFIIYAFTDDAKLAAKYPEVGNPVIIGAVFGGALLAVIVVIGVISALVIPKAIKLAFQVKMTEATQAVSSWEALQTTYAADAKKPGNLDEIGWSGPQGATSSWTYGTEVTGETAVFTATSTAAIGKCPAGSALTSTFTVGSEGFKHAAPEACRSLLTDF